MAPCRVYADFNNLDGDNRLKLNCAGTARDLERFGVSLREGLVLTFYTDDADDEGHPDNLLVEGVVHRDAGTQAWVARVDWSALRHVSQDPDRTDLTQVAPTVPFPRPPDSVSPRQEVDDDRTSRPKTSG